MYKFDALVTAITVAIASVTGTTVLQQRLRLQLMTTKAAATNVATTTTTKPSMTISTLIHNYPKPVDAYSSAREPNTKL